MRRQGDRPIHVLHVLGTMNRGGIETWLMHMLRHIDHQQFQMDFLIHAAGPQAYETEALSLGASIRRAPNPRNPIAYAHAFRQVIRQDGPYDLVHCHYAENCGFVLQLARAFGPTKGIAHIHTRRLRGKTSPDARTRAKAALMMQWIDRHATLGLAASRDCARDLYGADWEADPRWRVLYYGIDLAPFEAPVDCLEVRRELGIPPGTLVVGHVGRFEPVKNHRWLIAVVAELVSRGLPIHLLLVGDGPGRAEIEREVATRGLARHVSFVGLRSDVPRLMRGAMDVFVFPSLFEGLGLALVEAQAAGLPCVIADVIPADVDVVPALIKRLSLTQSAEAWADAILTMGQPRRVLSNPGTCLKGSPFDVHQSVKALQECYMEVAACHRVGSRRPWF